MTEIYFDDDWIREDEPMVDSYLGDLSKNGECVWNFPNINAFKTGTSIAWGRFLEGKKCLAAGAPKSRIMGQVFIRCEQLEAHEVLTGTQYGSGFGNELVAANVDGDGYDSIFSCDRGNCFSG